MTSKVEKSPRQPYCLKFTLDVLPKTANGSHEHWRSKAQRVKLLKQAVFARAWPFKPAQPLVSAALTLIRHSSLEPDYDNLVTSFKPVIDGLRQAGIISDDRKKNIGRPEYLWQKAPPKKGFITVEVREAEPCLAT